LKLIFRFDVPAHNNGGPFVNSTRLMVLLLLTFAQLSMIGLTALVLWLAGKYGDPPNWRWLRSLHIFKKT